MQASDDPIVGDAPGEGKELVTLDEWSAGGLDELGDQVALQRMHKRASGKSKNGAIDAFNKVIDNADKENDALDAREGRIHLSGSGDVSSGPR